MTRQEIFDFVSEHLLEQGVEAVRKHSSGRDECVFRTEKGLKCAIGCLIPESEYRPGFEGRNFLEVARALPKHSALRRASVDHPTLLGGLMFVHDECVPSEWKVRLASLAAEHDLEFKC